MGRGSSDGSELEVAPARESAPKRGSKGKTKLQRRSRKKIAHAADTMVLRGDGVRRRAERLKLARRKTLPAEPKYLFESITDRRTLFGVKSYRVMWLAGKHPVTKKQLFSYSFEPGVELVKDGCGELLKLVDDWVDNVERRIPFQQYLKSSARAAQVLGASEQNDCVFTAVGVAFELLGRYEVVTEERVADFVKTLTVDVSEGLAWKKTATLLRFLGLTVPGCALGWKQIGNRFEGAGSGFAGIFHLDLEDGVYLAGVSNSRRVGHCFALQVKWGTYWVFDDKWIPLGEAEYIRAIHFVRRLILEEE